MDAHANLITRLSFKPRFSIYLKSVSVCGALFFAAACATAPPSVTITETRAATVLSPDESLTKTYLALRQIPTHDPRYGTPETDVPIAARTLLTQIKHGLRELVGDTINRADNRNATPLQLRAQVVERLAQAKIKVTYPNDEEPPEEIYDPDKPEPEMQFLYGEVARIKITAPTHHPDLLAVTTTVHIPYGADTSLYLFRREAGSNYKLVLAHEASGYDEITGAQSNYDFAVSPSDANGEFFIVTANINPWFVSCWQLIRFAAMRVGNAPDAPHVLLNEDDSVYRCNDPFKVSTTKKGFTIEYDSSATKPDGEFDSDEILGRRLQSFVIKDDKVSIVSRRQLKPNQFELPAKVFAKEQHDE